MTRSVTSRTPEWDEGQRNLVLAQMASDADMGPHGIPMSVATDPVNQFKFAVDDPTVDWAERTLTETKEAHNKRFYTDRKLPLPAGDLWRVHLKTDGDANA